MSLIPRLFIKNYKDVDNPKVRFAYGRMCGVVGIISNFFLCALKGGSYPPNTSYEASSNKLLSNRCEELLLDWALTASNKICFINWMLLCFVSMVSSSRMLFIFASGRIGSVLLLEGSITSEMSLILCSGDFILTARCFELFESPIDSQE